MVETLRLARGRGKSSLALDADGNVVLLHGANFTAPTLERIDAKTGASLLAWARRPTRTT